MGKPKRIIITGAAGAVGYEVVKILNSRCNNCDKEPLCIAIDLPGKEKDFDEFKHVDYFGFDLGLEDPLLLDLFLERLKIQYNIVGIINCAAIVDISKSFDELENVNYRLVKILHRKFEFEPFIHISSASIYKSSREEIDEFSPIKTIEECNSPYEETKVFAENFLKSNYRGTLKVAILRPALIYGPRAGFLGAALAAIPSMMKSIPGCRVGFKGGPKTNWVHCEDVARACVYLLDNFRIKKDKSSFLKLNVADDVPYKFGDTINHYLKINGNRIKRRIPFPDRRFLNRIRLLIDNPITPMLLNVPVKLYWKMLKSLYLLEGRLNVSVDREFMPYLFEDMVFSNSLIKRYGFEFAWPDSRDAIPFIMDWYKENKWIPE